MINFRSGAGGSAIRAAVITFTTRSSNDYWANEAMKGLLVEHPKLLRRVHRELPRLALPHQSTSQLLGSCMACFTGSRDRRPQTSCPCSNGK